MRYFKKVSGKENNNNADVYVLKSEESRKGRTKIVQEEGGQRWDTWK